MSNRFHSKFHRSNHHTNTSGTNADAGHDPIASADSPFQGDFYLNGDLNTTGNALIMGNLSALGTWTELDTYVNVTSAMSITNVGTGPALYVKQTGDQAVAAFYDDSNIALYVDGHAARAGNVGINTTTPSTKLNVNGAIRVDNGYTLTVSDKDKNTTNNGSNGAYIVSTNDTTNPLQGYFTIVSSPTVDLRRIKITSVEQNVTYRNITLAEEGGKVGIGTATPGSTSSYSNNSKLDVQGGHVTMQFPTNTNGEVDIFIGKQTNNVVNGYIYGNDNEQGFYSGTSRSQLALGKTSNNPLAFINAGIGSNAFFSLAVNNNSDVIRADSSGKVGMGAYSPTTKLHVNGALTLNGEDLSVPLTEAGNTSGVYINFLSVGNSGITDYALLRQIGDIGDGTYPYINGNYHMSLDLFDDPNSASGGQQFSIRNVSYNGASPDTITSRFTINGLGAVGINNANPTARLDVEGNIRSTGVAASVEVAGGVYPILQIKNTAAPANLKYFRTSVTTAGVVEFTRVTDDYLTAYSALTIDTNNNIGINNLTPTNFGTNWKTLHINALSGGVFRASSTSNVYTDLYSDATNALGVIRTGSNHPLIFGTNTSERMRIDAAGRVGIGTTIPNPNLLLTINGAISANGDLIVTRTGTPGGAVYLNTYNQYIYGDQNGAVIIGTGNNYNLTIDSSGNTKIRSLSGTSTRTLQADANGTISAVTSDSTLKTSVSAIDYTLNDILALNPVSYNWKDIERFGAQREIGFIAQEVKEIIPEVIGINFDGTYSLEYSKLTSLLVKGIKELKAELDDVKTELKNIKSQIK